ncbi:hypothetical protein [Streptomyces atratus]
MSGAAFHSETYAQVSSGARRTASCAAASASGQRGCQALSAPASATYD